MIPSRTPPMPVELRERLRSELRALLVSAEERGWSAYRLDQAATIWSRRVPAPTDVLDLVAELRDDRDGGSRPDALRRVEHVAVAAVSQRLVREALTDGLTGLATRARLDDEVQHMVAVATRAGTPLTAVMIDLVGLKQINDSRGHQAGDAAIAEAGRAIRAHVRRSDRAFRWGGDEFALFMPGTTAEDALEVVARIQEGCATALTAGVATHSGSADDTDLDAWLARADADLYARRQRDRAPAAAVAPGARRHRRIRFGGLALSLAATAAASTIGWLGATNAASTAGQPAPQTAPTTAPRTAGGTTIATTGPAQVQAPAAVGTPGAGPDHPTRGPAVEETEPAVVRHLADRLPVLPTPAVLPTGLPAAQLPVPPMASEPPSILGQVLDSVLDGPP